MVITLASAGRKQDGVLGAMFAARKRVFVDLLKWDVPVVAGRFEIDQFDNEKADYLVVTDETGRHLASTRLLETTGPHILADLFPFLCEGEIPSGPAVREITRFCLDPDERAAGRREARDQLVAALAHHALENGIATYTGVADIGWFRQVIGFGWNCRPLGLPKQVGSSLLVGLAIDIGPDTPALLAGRGIALAARSGASLPLAA